MASFDALEVQADVRLRFPEFSSVTDDILALRVEEALAISAIRLLATSWLTAHLLALADGEAPSNSGEVTSEKIGDAQVTYRSQAEAGWESFYSATRYGRRYLELARRAPARAMPVRVY